MNRFHHESSVPDGAWPHMGIGHTETQDAWGLQTHRAQDTRRLRAHSAQDTHDSGHTGTEDTQWLRTHGGLRTRSTQDTQ